MAIEDASPFQAWVQAFDHYERMQRRYEAAGKINNQSLLNYLKPELEQAGLPMNTATRDLNAYQHR